MALFSLEKEELKWLPKNAFSTGVLLFLNCNEIKELFTDVYNHIKTHIKEKKKCLVQ